MKPQTAGNRPHQHLYGRRAWRRLRNQQLKQEPLCRMCKEAGFDTPAEVADHIIPHKGDWFLFHDISNLQSLCSACHNSVKQRMDAGFLHTTGRDGWPLEGDHYV